MQILLISHLFPKASDRRHGIFVLRRAEQLRALGHDIVVVSPVPYIPRLLTQVKRWQKYSFQTALLNVSGFEVHRPAYFRPPGAWYIGYESRGMWWGMKSTIRHLSKKRRFNLVLAEDFRGDVGAANMAADFLGVPCVGVAIGGDLNTDVHTSRRAFKTIIMNLLRCKMIVCESEELCSRVKDLTEERRQGVCIIRGTNLKTFQPVKSEKRKALRGKFGWSEEEVVILYTGYLERNKGIFELVDAFDKIAEAYQSVRLVFIGDGSVRRKFEERVAQSPFSKRIELRGHVDHDQIDKYYKASDLLSLPSFMEGLPNTVVEGIACGLPILATRVGGIPQAVPHGRVGLLVPPKDVKGLAEAMERMFVDKDLRSAMGMAAREHAEAHFDIVRNTNHFSEVLEETLKRSRKSELRQHPHVVQMVDLTSNSPFYTEELASALKAYPEVQCRACTNWMDLNWYKKCGLCEDLMIWVFRLEKRWPGLRKNRSLWRLVRTIGYFTAWLQVITRGVNQSSKIIHVQWCMVPIMDIIFFILLRWLDFRIVYTVHNALPHGNRRKATKWKYRQLYRLADALVVLGEKVRQNIEEWVQAGIEEKTHVIEHGLLMPKTPIPDRSEARRRIGLHDEDEVVLYFGGISDYKGIIDLIDAFHLASKQRPRLKLLIAGIAHEPFSPYEERIKHFDLIDKVRSWPKFVTEEFKMVLYAAADINILPHRDSSQSAMGLEALALGKPMIVTNSGALSDLIDPGRTGYLVPVQDPSAIAKAMVTFFGQSRKEQQAMSKASRQYGIKCFNWDVISSKHIALYRSLL
jgi:teichuronic acid biosynthesis glycosyltransferase TuaC